MGINLDKTEEKCCVCKKLIDNTSGFSIKNGSIFRFIPKGKSAHLECYIEHGVKQSIKKQLKD